MKKYLQFKVLLAIMLFATQMLFAAEPTNYYKSAMGKSDEALMTALRNIIRNHREVSYTSGLLNAFSRADLDDEGYIIDIYSNCRYRPSDSGSSASHMGEGYNREHSFPRSWFGGEVSPMNTDVFHIYPTDIKVNSQRGNYPYGECDGGTRLSYGNYVAKGKLGESSDPDYSGIVFEPDDEYKGDLARSYFYMVTCYKNELPSWPGSAQLDYGKNKYKAFSTWTINMLMKWTRLDPVSEKEIKRNDSIYIIQGNRNPFIDHPELAEYIWGETQGQAWNDSGEITTPAIITPSNGTTYYMGSTTVGTPKEYTITIKGENLTSDITLSVEDNVNFYVSRNSFTATEVNNGTSFDIGFKANGEGNFYNTLTLYSNEASSTFTVSVTATPQGVTPPPIELGDSIVEDWEGCTTGGYWTDMVIGNAFNWDFVNAGIWADNLSNGEQSCRLGKTSSSSITMTEDVEGGTSAIAFWAACFGSDADANLRVDYSTSQGSSWNELGDFTFTRGRLQQAIMEIPMEGNVRFRIVQTSGARVNIDDITIYGRVEQAQLTGDVNGDGEVGIADINTLIDIVLGGTTDEDTRKRADVNNDQEIGIADINTLINLILMS